MPGEGERVIEFRPRAYTNSVEVMKCCQRDLFRMMLVNREAQGVVSENYRSVKIHRLSVNIPYNRNSVLLLNPDRDILYFNRVDYESGGLIFLNANMMQEASLFKRLAFNSLCFGREISQRPTIPTFQRAWLPNMRALKEIILVSNGQGYYSNEPVQLIDYGQPHTEGEAAIKSAVQKLWGWSLENVEEMKGLADKKLAFTDEFRDVPPLLLSKRIFRTQRQMEYPANPDKWKCSNQLF